MKRKLLVILLAVSALLLVFAAAEETEPGWTETPYDEVNRIWEWHFGDLVIRIPGHYEVRGTAKNVLASTVAYDEVGVYAHSIKIELVSPDSKTGKALQQHEKKKNYDKALTAVIEAQFTKKEYDKDLVSRLQGTPDGTDVMITRQVKGTTWCSTYAALRIDGQYFLIASSAYSEEEARAGMDSCLNSLTWKGIRIRFDTMKGPVQYTDGYESAPQISNPLRRTVSAAVATDEQGVQQCDVTEYGFTFACPSGVHLLMADSPDEAWEHVMDMRLYNFRLETAKNLPEPDTTQESKVSGPSNSSLTDAVNAKRAENIRIAFCALMALKRSFEDGSCLGISPETVALIAPEGAVDWNLKINVGPEGEFSEKQAAEEKTLKPLLDRETKASANCARTVSEKGFRTIGSKTYAYLYDASSFQCRFAYFTFHKGRRIEVILTVTKPKRAEYLDLVPFAEDLLGRFSYTD